jgi:hypothetical protein
MEKKGFINSTLEHPAKFSAEPFEKVLDIFIKSRIGEARRIENKRTEILSDWQSIAIKEVQKESAKFSILEGKNYIYPKLRQMIESTKVQLSLIVNFPEFIKLDQFGIIDVAIDYLTEKRSQMRLLIELKTEDFDKAKKILNSFPKTSNFEKKLLNEGLKITPRMVIKDDEVLFFVSPGEKNILSEETCLWTNSSTIVDSYKVLFESLWANSAINDKDNFTNDSNGKVVQNRFKFQEFGTYEKVLESAKKEIFILTSSKGLVDIKKEFSILKNLTGKGVSIRIMAPILGYNLKDAIKLSEICQIKHVFLDYWKTTIVDNEYLFQFQKMQNALEETEQLSSDSIYCTSDIEYVNKTRIILEEIWKNSIAPSKVTFEEITKQTVPSNPPVPYGELTGSKKNGPYQKSLAKLEEIFQQRPIEYVLNKIVNAKTNSIHDILSEPNYAFGSMASAVVHSPNSFEIPDMIIGAYHWNKQATFGEEDWLFIQLLLETSKGKVFVPSAIASDNSKSMAMRKLMFKGTPAAENYLILRRNQLSVQLHGNTLFASWKTPIPLIIKKQSLPPGAIIFEGYGNIKSIDTCYNLPSEWEIMAESNGFEAFVTYFHPALKYSGPATDGIIARDYASTVYPPKCKHSRISSY